MNTNNRPPTSLGDPVTAGSLLLPALNVEARSTLERHGCTVNRDGEAYVITYPLDTVKRMMLPTMLVTRNYRVLLPDGYELIESHDTGGRLVRCFILRTVSKARLLAAG